MANHCCLNFVCLYLYLYSSAPYKYKYKYSRAKKWVGVRPTCDDLGPFAVDDVDTLTSQNPRIGFIGYGERQRFFGSHVDGELQLLDFFKTFVLHTHSLTSADVPANHPFSDLLFLR